MAARERLVRVFCLGLVGDDRGPGHADEPFRFGLQQAVTADDQVEETSLVQHALQTARPPENRGSHSNSTLSDYTKVKKTQNL